MSLAATTIPHVTASPSAQARKMRALCWVLRLVAAAILAQTLFFKFTGAPESVYIFSTLGMEPWGRIGAGLAELVACALLLTTRTAVIGAALSLGIMVGAIGGHLTKLGIVVQEDGGLLFALALIVTGCSLALLSIHRKEIAKLLQRD